MIIPGSENQNVLRGGAIGSAKVHAPQYLLLPLMPSAEGFRNLVLWYHTATGLLHKTPCE